MDELDQKWLRASLGCDRPQNKPKLYFTSTWWMANFL